MSMNTVPERLAALRAAMDANGVDLYLIPVGDPHSSEYLPDHYTSLTYFSGFHGENSNFVVTRDKSALAQQVTAATAEKTALAQQVTTATAEKTALAQQIAALQQQIAKLQSGIATPATPITPTGPQIAQKPETVDVVDKLPAHATKRYATRTLDKITHIAIHHSAGPANLPPERIAQAARELTR